jgi:hypothetical protein
MSKRLNSELKKYNFTCDPSRRGVKGSPDPVGHEICDDISYGEKPAAM